MISRRHLLGAIPLAASAAPLVARSSTPVAAIAFDAFVLFSPASLVERARLIVGERAPELVAAASAKLFASTWLYTSADRYLGFQVLAEAAFGFAARSVGMPLTRTDLTELVRTYSALEPWSDVTTSLQQLRRRNVRLAILSNLPEAALFSNLRRAQLNEYVEIVLSTDQVRRYKPAREAYRMAVSALALDASCIGFAASAAWDAAGASWFGYPTVWVNRAQAPADFDIDERVIVSNGMEGVLALASSQ